MVYLIFITMVILFVCGIYVDVLTDEKNVELFTANKVNSGLKSEYRGGSVIDSKMGEDIKDSVENMDYQKQMKLKIIDRDPESYLTENVSPNESLNFYNKTEYSTGCCKQYSQIDDQYIYSSRDEFRTNGCPCLHKDQIQYINIRGGNHGYGEVHHEDSIMI